MKETVFLNGQFVPKEKAKVSALGPGFLYGWGLFETMRSYHNKIVYFEEHLKRIRESCKLIKMKPPYTLNRLKDIVQETIKINDLRDAHVRLTLWKSERGTDILIIAKKYQPYPFRKYNKGFCACISPFRQNEDSFLAQLKTTNYLFYRLAFTQAIQKGFDEAIILNNKGYIAEASRSNLFFIKNRELFTPSLESSCLDGITRRVIFDIAKKYHIKAYEGAFSILDLYACEEAFLTNSLMGIMPLVSVEGRRIGRGRSRYKLTRFFIEKYKSLYYAARNPRP
ncbi:MAG: aminotransferase class IV [Candidatus Omnitrophota bacterium]|nr:aminotransferase class IV [Candidatus Omnitrophota bacterium]